MKLTRYAILTLASVFAIADASAAGKLGTSAKPLAPRAKPSAALQSLKDNVTNSHIFQVVQPKPGCAEFMILTEAANDMPFKKAGDLVLNLTMSVNFPMVASDDPTEFASGVNKVYLRPGLPQNQLQTLNSKWPSALGYSHELFRQLENGPQVVAAYSSTLVAVNRWPHFVRQSFTYNAKDNSFTYHFSETGKPTVDCAYE